MNDIRMTEQRRLIIDAVRIFDGHPTASEVYSMVRERLPHISLGTVYRNLEILSDLGVIRRLDLGDTQRRYDSCTDKHYHVRCIRCGLIEDIEIDSLDSVLDRIKKTCDWKILGHNFEVLGICPDCKNKSQAHTKQKQEEDNV